MRQIVLIGDSLTEQGYLSNWASRLHNWYIRRADVLNRGLSGYNSRWVLDILKDDSRRDSLLPSNIGRPLFVTLLLGSNDAAKTGQYVSLEEYKANMREIIDIIRKHAAPVGGIFVFTPPPVDEEAWLQRMNELNNGATSTNRTVEDVRLYRNAVLQLVSEEAEIHHDLFVIDLFKLFLGDGADTAPYSKAPWCDCFYDGLHFNDEGGRRVFEALRDVVVQSPNADAILPDSLPYAVPPHDTLWNRSL